MWFSKKNIPIVKFNGITAEIEKLWSQVNWKFTYKNITFVTEEHILEIPSIETLDKFLSWIDGNKDKIQQSISENMAHWDEAKLEAAKIDAIEIQNINKISVLYVGDETWGDMGGDFLIENGIIINEGWGD